MLFDILVGLLKIVWIDVLLSGDNAIVISLACRNLGDRRKLGMALGAAVAVVLRIACTGIVAYLMEMSYLKVAGSLMLMYVALGMVIEGDDDGSEPSGHSALFWAVMTVVGADIVMSMDNVVAVAAASHGNMWLMGFGLLLSIPLVVTGANLITSVIDRFPVLIWISAGYLGWMAGDMAITDPVFHGVPAGMDLYASITGAVLVLGAGLLFKKETVSA